MGASLLRLLRLLALVIAVGLLHLAAKRNETHFRTSLIALERALQFFPDAVEILPSTRENGADEVYDDQHRLIGFVATASPQADSVIGYAGPNNVLVALDAKGRVVGTELLSSGDTEAHIAEVKKADKFWKQFVGWTPSQEPLPKIEGVAGSTLTSLGIAEALQKRLAGHAESLRFPDVLTLEEVRALFPTAKSFQMDSSRPGWHSVKDGADKLLGYAVRTSPASDYTRGHSGPTESLLAVSPDGKNLLGVRLRRSYDTKDYADMVSEDADYLRQLTNFSVQQWSAIDLKKAGLEGVSGATETSFAVADGIHRRFAADAKATPPKTTSHFFKARDWALLGVIAGSFVMTFSSLRGRRPMRLLWQVVLIGVFGLWCGDLLSVALLAGWARNGLAWQLAPSLVILAAVALLVPWATRRQIYCYQLCPHGAAQEWLGRFKTLHIHMPVTVAKYLRFFPGILLAIAFVLALLLPRFDLAMLEPFDAWAMRGAVLVTTVIALIGLVASLFVPMAYCRYGCPTGALLKFLRSTGSNDHFGLRDRAAWILLLAASVFVFWPAQRMPAKASEPSTELHGPAFGTTWSVKLRGANETIVLQKRLAAELERIESTLSHWRTNSATSRFNAARTTQPVEMPEELVALVARALEISRASDGAFDITVAPLVQAWGFGPNGTPPHAPDAEELARLRSFTGWEKLLANTNANTLQKNHPDLQIDLGAILQGYAADRLAAILAENKQTNFLINVGGELLARGRWRVAIEDPARPEQPLRTVSLENTALATSGTYRAKRADGKKKWSHLINPHTGEPIEHDTVLVSVIDASCARADAWATTLIVTGGQRAEELASTNKISALFVSSHVVVTTGFPPDER
jgi:NosR/NirI family nitrous oxide reductase transcriptional regulator